MIVRLLLPIGTSGPKHTELAMQQDEHVLTVSMLCYQPADELLPGMSDVTEQLLRLSDILAEAAIERLISEVNPELLREVGITMLASGKSILSEKLGLTP